MRPSGRLNFGHCTATCIDPQSGSWCKFNDERVSGIGTSSLDEAGAYILFIASKEVEEIIAVQLVT